MPGGATILVCGVRAVFCAGHRRRGRRRFAQFLPCTAVRDRVGAQPATRRFRGVAGAYAYPAPPWPCRCDFAGCGAQPQHRHSPALAATAPPAITLTGSTTLVCPSTVLGSGAVTLPGVAGFFDVAVGAPGGTYVISPTLEPMRRN